MKANGPGGEGTPRSPTTGRKVPMADVSVVEARIGAQGHPHACWDGKVFLTYTAYDEEIGDEVEKIEVIPCRRCVEEGK